MKRNRINVKPRAVPTTREEFYTEEVTRAAWDYALDHDYFNVKSKVHLLPHQFDHHDGW